jgi:hypothetical protein
LKAPSPSVRDVTGTGDRAWIWIHGPDYEAEAEVRVDRYQLSLQAAARRLLLAGLTSPISG